MEMRSWRNLMATVRLWHVLGLKWEPSWDFE